LRANEAVALYKKTGAGTKTTLAAVQTKQRIPQGNRKYPGNTQETGERSSETRPRPSSVLLPQFRLKKSGVGAFEVKEKATDKFTFPTLCRIFLTLPTNYTIKWTRSRTKKSQASSKRKRHCPLIFP
jgi:hypothetical protein